MPITLIHGLTKLKGHSRGATYAYSDGSIVESGIVEFKKLVERPIILDVIFDI